MNKKLYRKYDIRKCRIIFVRVYVCCRYMGQSIYIFLYFWCWRFFFLLWWVGSRIYEKWFDGSSRKSYIILEKTLTNSIYNYGKNFKIKNLKYLKCSYKLDFHFKLKQIVRCIYSWCLIVAKKKRLLGNLYKSLLKLEGCVSQF